MRQLEDPSFLRRADPGNMLGHVEALSRQCRQAWTQGRGWVVSPSFRSAGAVVVLGMGGSAIGADLLQGAWGDDASKPIFVNRTYHLPRWVGRQTLVFVCSYSGNTEETLSAAEIARRQGAKLLVVTSGGLLTAWSQRHRIPLTRIPSGLPPRSAVGYLTFIPMGVFAELGWLKEREMKVEQSLAGLERWVSSRLDPSVPTSRNPAKQLAGSLVGRLPVVYGAAGGWEGVTYRWRTQIEENAKTLAFHHLFPEATHNEISGWVHPPALMKHLTALFLTDPQVHPRTLRRMRFAQGVILRQGAQAQALSVSGPHRLERMLKLMVLGDFVSVYLGMLYGVDPTPVERVEALKQYLKRPVPFKGQRGQAPGSGPYDDKR